MYLCIEESDVKIPVLSSAYILSFTCSSLPGSFKPLISSELQISYAKGSKQMTCKGGESEQPCLTPGLTENEEEIKLLTITEADISVYRSLIHFIKFSSNPKAANAEYI